MSKFKFKKVVALVMALILTLSTAVVGSFAGQKVEPLFTINDVETRQGEEFSVTIKFAQEINPKEINIAALDVSLKYDSDIYTPINMTTGDGLNAAFEKLSNGTVLHLEKGYIYSSSYTEPDEVKWSLTTIDGFTFKKDSVFATVTFKANDVSTLEGDVNMKVEVTNAMTNKFDTTTMMYPSVTNKIKIDLNLAKLCDWEFDAAGKTYTLAKFNDTNAKKFTIPDVYEEKDNGTWPVARIKYGAFTYCTKLENVVIGKNVKKIDGAAFFNCENLKKVTIYSDDISIGDKAFVGASKDLVIKCKKGSAAEAYAKANSIKVEYFGNISTMKYTGLEGEKYYNDGIPAEFPNLKFYDEDGTVLVPGKDYKIEYENNVNVGTATIHITGIGDYVGSRDLTFEVKCPYHTSDSKYYSETPFYADCEEGGKLVKYCSFCKFRDDSTVLLKKAHEKDQEVSRKEATCTEEGKITYSCKNCNAFIEEKIPKKAHTEGWVVYEEATCKKAGLEVWGCTECKEVLDSTKTQTIPQKTHNCEWVVTKEATCMKNGTEEWKCPYCGENDGETKVRTIEARGYHVPAAEWVTVTEATCAAEGLEQQVCKDCNEVINERPIAKKAHVASSETITFAPTCTEDGYRIIVCKNCNSEMGRETTDKAYGHSLSAYGVIKEATCTEKGKVGQICSRCKAEVNVSETPALDHDFPLFATTIKPATCTEDGYTGRECRRCGTVKDKNIIKARGYHKYGEETVAVAATCQTQGFKVRVCEDCGDVQISVIKETGHKEMYVPSILPTYKRTGVDKAVCEYCGIDLAKTMTVDKVVPDLDSDKKVTATDALMILQHATKLVTLNGTALRNADCNGDASVNSTDALLVLQLATGLISA